MNIRVLLIVFMMVLGACSTQATESPTNAPAAEDTATSAPPPTETTAPTATITLTPGPTSTFAPIFDIGVKADLGTTDDYIGIDGVFEIISMTEIEVTDFLFTVVEAPGVDIRLGVDRDFSDEVAVSLRDITGNSYENRDFKLTIPAAAFDGRSFNSIGIYCYDTGDLFDFAVFESP